MQKTESEESMENTQERRGPWMTTREAEAYTRLHTVTLWRAVKDGRLKVHKVGSANRYHVDDLDAFMRGEG